MKESQALIDKMKKEVLISLKGMKTPVKEWRTAKERIKTNLEKLVNKELERFPLIIPIIIRM